MTFLFAAIIMPLKSLPPQPIPRDEDAESLDSEGSAWQLTSEEAEASSPGALFYDPALSTEAEASQVPDVGDLETQVPVDLPNVPLSLVEAEEEPDVSYEHSDIAKFVVHKDKKIHITELQWDKCNTMGQIRQLSKDLVEHYVRSLKKAPPRKMIRILAKATPGLFC